jgi:hypothetical protein
MHFVDGRDKPGHDVHRVDSAIEPGARGVGKTKRAHRLFVPSRPEALCPLMVRSRAKLGVSNHPSRCGLRPLLRMRAIDSTRENP